MKNKTAAALHILLLFGIGFTVFALALVPLVLTASFKHYEDFMLQYPYAPWQITGVVYLCAIPYLLSLFRLNKIVNLFRKNDAFSPLVSVGFCRIGIYALAEAALLAAAPFSTVVFFDTYMYALTLLPAVVFPLCCLAVALLSFAISGVFQKATEIKEENDLVF